jgi:AcrR family transcriptional regulator
MESIVFDPRTGKQQRFSNRPGLGLGARGSDAQRRTSAGLGVVTRRASRGAATGPSAAKQRARLIAAMTVLAAEHGWQSVAVDLVCERAAISKRTFYDLFADREDCFVAAVGLALEHTMSAVGPAVARAGRAWPARAGAALAAILSSLDGDRIRAWVIAVEASDGSERARRVRREAFAPLADLIDEGAGDVPATGTAASAALLELVYRHLTGPEADSSMLALIAPAAYLVLAPRVGRRTALQQAEALARAAERTPGPPAPLSLDDVSPLRLTQLTEATLLFLASHPGARNIEIAAAVGVTHESQMSRHLGRLVEANAAHRVREGRVNAWELTDVGRRLVTQLRAAGAAS